MLALYQSGPMNLQRSLNTMKRGKLNPFDDINQFWEYEKEREKEEAKLKLLAGEMRMANSSDALGKYHCSIKKKAL